MKKWLLFLFVFCSATIHAQTFYNEWVDYSKTYYKFKVGSTGLYRISAAALQTVGLSTTNVSHFQLWRNGKQVPLFTSASAGTLGADGYIEFWGEKNDGLPDRDLYRLPSYQLSHKESLLTDTACYFLTVNSAGGNVRYEQVNNPVSENTLPRENFFLYTASRYFKERIHKGWAEVVGSSFIYSSSYDIGEVWSTHDIHPSSPVTITMQDLQVAPEGPAATVKVAMAGSARINRIFTVDVNNTEVIRSSLNTFEAKISTNTAVPLSLLNNNTATIKIQNRSTNGNDKVVSSFVEIEYPRKFDFNNQSSFAFNIAASSTGRYLEIVNFNSGGAAPVLYDVSNRRRYVADISTPGVVKVVLAPSLVTYNLVLVSQAAPVAVQVQKLFERKFINYQQEAWQSNYAIITHNTLRSSTSDYPEMYRAYRSSVAGGSFNAKLYDIDELVDQFGYGIKKNPLSIKNFLKYARSVFVTPPAYVFIIGKGLTYAEYRENETSEFADRLNLVPTWGYPASDIILGSDNMEPVMSTPVSRLSVLYPIEIAAYLEKVKEYESAQKQKVQKIDSIAWMKNVLHVVGASDAALDNHLTSYMRRYEATIEDTLFGGIVTNFNKSATGPVTPATTNLMRQKFAEGISLLSYFGHSSSSSLDYNLNNPYEYNNAGKYPLFNVSGCNAGNFYAFEPSRLSNAGTLSETYVLARERGAIGFIASTHFGVDAYLDFYNQLLYKSFATTGYGRPVIENINETIKSVVASLGSNNRLARLHSEQTTLHGDPAVKLNSFPQPDYAINATQIKVLPGNVAVTDTAFVVKVNMYNLGRAINDSLTVIVKHTNSRKDSIIFNNKIPGIRFLDSLSFYLPVVANRDVGENKITVTLDALNSINEQDELNNTATAVFDIRGDVLHPVYPYRFSIVGNSRQKLITSTAEPAGTSRFYIMQIDTTANFNSPVMVETMAVSSGGTVTFDPGFDYQNNTVYYWRVSPLAPPPDLVWNTSSFIHIAGAQPGFNQSHSYQHLQSNTASVYLDTIENKWKFGNREEIMYVTNSIYPLSGDEDSDFRISMGDNPFVNSGCVGHSILFTLFDPKTLKPYYNQQQPSTHPSGNYGNFMGSYPVCNAAGRQYNFEYSYMDTTGRRLMRDFLDWVPAGTYVVMRILFDWPYDQNPLVNVWKNDQQVYGAGNTFYDRLKTYGFADIDSFNRERTWAFITKKSDPNGPNNLPFSPVYRFSEGLNDQATFSVILPARDTAGIIISPVFGPAKAWRQAHWQGGSIDNAAGDTSYVSVLGIKASGQADTLYRLTPSAPQVDITAINPKVYPNLQLVMHNTDGRFYTPYQLANWKLFYDPVPEGAIATEMYYNIPDTVATRVGADGVEPKLSGGFAFRNVSLSHFDSLAIKLVLYDSLGKQLTYNMPKVKPLMAGDTLHVNFDINVKDLAGLYNLYVIVNPDGQQPEQHSFNNFLYQYVYFDRNITFPVTLLNFGVARNGGDVALSWQVANEVEVKEYIVEHSKDGLSFIAIGKVSAYNINGTKNYFYLHRNIPPGTSYYRLKMVDKDNNFVYSAVRNVTLREEWVQVYPNPVAGSLNIKTLMPNTEITLINAFGQPLWTRQITGQQQIDVRKLPPGSYWLKVRANQQHSIIKIQKQ